MQTGATDDIEPIFEQSKCHNCKINPSNISNYGDLYIIGKIWVTALKSALLGSNLSLIPIVKADVPPPPPKRPPTMKYKDLPIYKSPHYEYKDFVERKSKCPEANVKIMRRYLLPYVTICRKEVQEKSCEMACAVMDAITNIRKSINETQKEFKATMRDPDKIMIRRAAVFAGAGAGYLLGTGKGIPRRMFMTAAGAATGGALCFPKETDDAFRNFTYYTGKTILGVFNWSCGKDFSWRERLPCKEDLPTATDNIKSQCPKQKK